jgi:hypothetical protein
MSFKGCDGKESFLQKLLKPPGEVRCYDRGLRSASRPILEILRKERFRLYNILIIPCYRKMKSGDTLHLLRNASAPCGSSALLPTQAKVSGAHENAKTKI